MMSFPVTLAAGLNNDLFPLVNAEKKEQQEYHLLGSISFLLFDNGGPDFYFNYLHLSYLLVIQ